VGAKKKSGKGKFGIHRAGYLNLRHGGSDEKDGKKHANTSLENERGDEGGGGKEKGP